MTSAQTLQRLGLSWQLIAVLAALAIPRAIGHDVRLLDPDSGLNRALALLPLLIWVVVLTARRVPRPFVAMLLIGLAYGVMLAVTHQVFWTSFWGDAPPSIGGNLEGRLSPLAESLVLRTFASFSSIITGLVTGAVAGLAALLARLLVPKPTAPKT